MKQNILFINIFIVINAILIYGQTVERSEQIRREIRQQERVNQDFKILRDTKVGSIELPIYKLSKADKLLIAPDAALKSAYAEFLRLPDTEITKILNVSCFEIGDVKLSNGCKSGIPGYGSFYSFNHKRHLSWESSNIHLDKDQFVTTGFSTLGIIVSLGEVEIEKLSLQSDGVKFLADFVPAEIKSEAEKQVEKIKNGIKAGSYVYKQAEKVKESTVYAMRSVAYRSKVRAASFNARKDIIVTFKVIRREENGNVVLIWRQLQTKDASELREK